MSLCYVFHVKGTTVVKKRFKEHKRPVETEIVFWDADLTTMRDRYEGGPVYLERLAGFAACRATGWSGAWTRSASSNGYRRMSQGDWAQEHIKNTGVEVVITYMGEQDRVPPIPDSIILSNN